MMTRQNGAGIPARWISVLGVAVLGLAGCGQRWEVFTCSYGTGETSCTAVKAPLQPKDGHELHFTLPNPNAATPSCAGELSLSVNMAKKGYVLWSGHELDATTCAAIGGEISGESELGPDGMATDVRYPIGDFTFRVEVRPDADNGPDGDPAH